MRHKQRGGGALPDFILCYIFPVQQATSWIGHRVKKFFRAGNQYAEHEKQQQQQLVSPRRDATTESRILYEEYRSYSD